MAMGIDGAGFDPSLSLTWLAKPAGREIKGGDLGS
jgi:hypothetical protein